MRTMSWSCSPANPSLADRMREFSSKYFVSNFTFSLDLGCLRFFAIQTPMKFLRFAPTFCVSDVSVILQTLRGTLFGARILGGFWKLAFFVCISFVRLFASINPSNEAELSHVRGRTFGCYQCPRLGFVY